MRRTIVISLALLILAVGFAPSSFAATASFQGSCSALPSPTYCVFDSARPLSHPSSCGNYSISEYTWYWSWDDITYVEIGSSPTFENLFPANTMGFIILHIKCSDPNKSEDYVKHCFSNSVGIAGCILATGTWMP